MSDIDPLDLDGRQLQLLIAVIEERSITRAALRLGVTQSAVSHGLERLRGLVGDPLVVKSGRGIVPTAHAMALAEQARSLLDAMRSFATACSFDPARLQLCLTLAANPLQRDLLLPRLLQYLQQQAPGVSLRVLPSDVPSTELLRDAGCHLVISPRPPDAADVLQRRLFEDGYRVFYDPAVRAAPDTRQAYEAAEHVTVVYHQPRRLLDIDRVLTEMGVQRRIVVQVADFSGVRPFIRGSNRVATMPALLRIEQLSGLAEAPVPLACPPMPMYMIWHQRFQADPMHRWLREALLTVSQELMPGQGGLQGAEGPTLPVD